MVGQFTVAALAGGTIRPNRFVKVSTAADNTVLEADANERVCGVCYGSSEDFTSTSHVTSGNQCMIRAGGIVEIEAGGSITRGALVKSDADGKAVAAATTGTTLQWVAGEALESGADTKMIKIKLNIFSHYPALST